MIRQICYLSTASPGFRDGDIAALLSHAERNNTAAGITGLLAYGAGLFFQVVEGPRDSVGAALHRIRRDERHAGLRVLQDDIVEGRDFADWRMGFRTLDEATVAAVMSAAAVDAAAIPAIVAGLSNPLSGTFVRRFAVAA